MRRAKYKKIIRAKVQVKSFEVQPRRLRDAADVAEILSAAKPKLTVRQFSTEDDELVSEFLTL